MGDRRKPSDRWTRVFRIFFRMTPARMTRAIRRHGLGTAEELVVIGRRSGLERRLLVTVTERDGRWYIGHPNGREAAWVRNLEAAGVATLNTRRDGSLTMTALLLPDCDERTTAIEDTIRAVPFPVSLVYRSGRRHVHRTGAYFRLEPVPSEESSAV